MYHKDTGSHMEVIEIATGFVVRREKIVRSRVVDMMGRLRVDLFLQVKFLMNGVEVKIRLVRSKNAFALMAGSANPNFKIKIVNVTGFVKKVTLNPSVQMAHIKAPEKSSAKYPMRPVECKVYSIPTETRSHTHENLFLGTLPKRLVLCCINNDAYNGSFDKNPFNFLAVYVDGRQIPSKPFQLNFDNDFFVRSNLNLFTTTGKVWQEDGNWLSRADFRHGYTFFGLDLTPDSCDGACFHLVQRGNLCIEINFNHALTTTIDVIAYGESDSVLEINKTRNVIYNFW